MKFYIENVLAREDRYEQKQLVNFVASIGKQSTSVLNVLENLLAWANCQRNNISYQPKKQDILLAVQTNLDLLSKTAKKKNITIRNEIQSTILLNYDLNLISTVVRNLIANAIKFTKKDGEIVIRALKIEENIEISVTDTGVGIDSERIEKIFDNTTYETTYGTDREKGSGLGLKLCQDFVVKHNGKIWVESELNKGSSFIFTLPIAK